MKTFVTFLGRGRENKTTGYQETTYEFPDKSTKTTAFFGLALAEYINPDRIVILGTNSSQWGVLVENLAAEGDEEEERLKLIDVEIESKIEQEHLDNVTGLMCRAVGCEVVPRLIPFGENESEQYKILDVIANYVPEGIINFDLTHGFRHFGMIGFLSAFMLSRVRGLEVKNLWYGALDMTKEGVTPVLKLDGLDRVRRWLNALNRFDATGDYGVFASLLTEDGVEEAAAGCLRKAAFYERTLNLSAAVDEIRKFIPILECNLTGASGLFQQRLTERLTWTDLNTYSKQQAELARLCLRRRDYIRAAVFGWESLVSEMCEKKGLDPKNREHRADQNVLGPGALHKRTVCENLNRIRNALAHSNPHNSEMIRDEQKLRETLQNAFDCLLPSQD